MSCSKSRIWGFLTVIGAALFHLSLGYTYTSGNMSPYLRSYMNITHGETVWFHAVIISCQAAAMPLGGLLESKIGFRPVVAVSALLCSVGIALSALTVNYGLGAFLFTYTIMFGIGMGLPYSVLFSLAAEWFPKHRAVVIGIILGGFGMGALVFTPIQTALINPNNLPTTESRLKATLFCSPEVRMRVPRSFLILAAIMFGLQVIGFFLCHKYKPHVGDGGDLGGDSSDLKIDDEYELQSITIESDKEQSSLQDTVNYTVGEALKSIDFYLIGFIVFINTIPITLQSVFYKVFGAQNHLDDRFLSIVATCTAIFNCSGRVIWGLICDKISFKLPLEWLLVQWAILFGTLPVIAMTRAFQALFAVWVFLLFFTMSGHFVLLPGACSRIFGPKYMATTYGLLYFTTASGRVEIETTITILG
ncbi:unnamed protein product [Mesocestoides corti]|uniref:Major facilitator superfamily (MFS) profile domain-containing protein n=1 Tax=Mesocestoides corti TaxID=53468 RepID=A0A0R3UI64_MESCO|nr:unnamed protein product [Mesocestoides corti]